MKSICKDDLAFQALLAGANLLHCLSSDERLLWTDRVVVKLHAIESNTGDAIICKLDINPHREGKLPAWNTSVPDVTDQVASAFSYYTVAGDMNSVSNIMNKLKNNSLVVDEFRAFDYLLGEAIEAAVSCVLGPLEDAFKFVMILVNYASQNEQDRLQAEKNAVIRDNTFGDIAAYSSKGFLGDCGFAFNLRIDENSNPNVYLAAEAKIFISEDAEKLFNNLADAYNAQTGNSYTLNDFLSEMQGDTYNSVVPNKNGPTNATNDFLMWCNEPAELERKDGDGTTDKHAHSNYYYILNKYGTLKEYKYSWE